MIIQNLNAPERLTPNFLEVNDTKSTANNSGFVAESLTKSAKLKPKNTTKGVSIRDFDNEEDALPTGAYEAIRQGCKDVENHSLLPYSKNRDDIKLPATYNVLIENVSAFNKVIQILTSDEAELKSEYINICISLVFKKFQKKLRKYNNDMKVFIHDNMIKINIERTRFMLNTHPELLRKIQTKEQLQATMAKANVKAARTVQSNMAQLGKLTFERDHLPFSNLILKIAKKMDGSPTKPVLELEIEKEHFKKMFLDYHTFMKNNIKETLHKNKNRDSTFVPKISAEDMKKVASFVSRMKCLQHYDFGMK